MPDTPSSEVLERQLGFELLSIFKGATTESIDEAVERVICVVCHPASPTVVGQRDRLQLAIDEALHWLALGNIDRADGILRTALNNTGGQSST